MNNTPAFAKAAHFNTENEIFDYGQEGMMLLDYIAAKAMLGILSGISVDSERDFTETFTEALAVASYKTAAAMLKVRESYFK